MSTVYLHKYGQKTSRLLTENSQETERLDIEVQLAQFDATQCCQHSASLSALLSVKVRILLPHISPSGFKIARSYQFSDEQSDAIDRHANLCHAIALANRRTRRLQVERIEVDGAAQRDRHFIAVYVSPTD